VVCLTIGRWFIVSIVCLIAIVIGVLVYLQYYLPGEEESIIPYPGLVGEVIRGSKKLLSVRVIGFGNSSFIPSNLTCDGIDRSPEIIVDNIPNHTVSLAIIVYDPDAPGGVFYHWIIYNVRVNGSNLVIPPNIPREMKTNIGVQGLNDFGEYGYRGPCPPKGHGKHRYVFLVLALDSIVEEKSYRGEEFLNTIKDHVIGYGVYYGVYER